MLLAFLNSIANTPSSIFYFIRYIDSIILKAIVDEETQLKPVLFNFDNSESRQNDSQHVKLQTEYRLFTYFNNIKYYLDIKIGNDDDDFELKSTYCKNTVKGS